MFQANVVIAAVCLVGLWFYGKTAPVNFVLVTGVGWVLVSSFDLLLSIRRRNKK